MFGGRSGNTLNSCMPAIGQSIPRKEGRAKVTGQARYVDDLRLPGMLHGVTVRSPSPRGVIRDIRYGPGIPWDAITIVTARDIPGANVVALITDDQPYLAAGTVNHAEEPVLLLAHADPVLLQEARRSVTIEIDPLPPVFTMDEALSGREIIWGADNLFKSYLVSRGDVDAALAAADTIVEGEYDTGAQEQLYIEPNGMLAVAHVGGDVDGVTVWGSMQCPYYIHKALAALFSLPGEKIRVVQMETGGGFGGKEEYPSIIAGHAALLAWKAERPVKMMYDRAEDMVATTKRHPSRTRHRTGDHEGRPARRDGHRLHDRRRRVLHAVRRSSCPAARSTRRDRTSVRTSACAGARSRRTRRRTAPSAGSARRKASSRSSATWTGSQPPSGFRPRSSAGAISSRPARRAPWGR